MSEYIIGSDGELYHYGVKGQKWGIRRYQNADGSLTSAGKKRAKQEYKRDNKTAFELGKNATISGRAAAYSVNRTARLKNKFEKRQDKDPDSLTRRTKSLRDKLEASAKTTEQLSAVYTKHKAAAEAHCKSLMDKYGKEAVSSIKYKDINTKNGKTKVMNERTSTLTDYAISGLSFVAATGAIMMGAPVGVYTRPLTTREKASRLEASTYFENLNDRRRQNKK